MVQKLQDLKKRNAGPVKLEPGSSQLESGTVGAGGSAFESPTDIQVAWTYLCHQTPHCAQITYKETCEKFEYVPQQKWQVTLYGPFFLLSIVNL